MNRACIWQDFHCVGQIKTNLLSDPCEHFVEVEKEEDEYLPVGPATIRALTAFPERYKMIPSEEAGVSDWLGDVDHSTLQSGLKDPDT